MTNEDMQTRYQALEEQVTQLKESTQKSLEDLRQIIIQQQQINQSSQQNLQGAQQALQNSIAELAARVTMMAPSQIGVTNLHPDAILDCFISGLKPTIQNELAIHKPSNLHDAIALAKLIEDKLQSYNQKSISWKPTNTPIPTTTRNETNIRLNPRPPLLPLPPPNPSNPPKIALPICRLTAVEMQTRRAQGLCFNCDEQFKPSHRCRTHPFLLLLTEEP
ncbi:hypothetical protein WN943_018086 [Citrus x changshan-huyou]